MLTVPPLGERSRWRELGGGVHCFWTCIGRGGRNVRASSGGAAGLGAPEPASASSFATRLLRRRILQVASSLALRRGFRALAAREGGEQGTRRIATAAWEWPGPAWTRFFAEPHDTIQVLGRTAKNLEIRYGPKLVAFPFPCRGLCGAIFRRHFRLCNASAVAYRPEGHPSNMLRSRCWPAWHATSAFRRGLMAAARALSEMKEVSSFSMGSAPPISPGCSSLHATRAV